MLSFQTARTRITTWVPGFSLAAGLCVSLGMTPAVQGQYWGPSYHSSTAAESEARGLGALIRDQGEANLLNAQAASELENARSQSIQNSVDAVQAYYDRRRVHDEFYAKKNAERQARSERFLARRGGLPEISENDINVSNGTVNWPSALMLQQYDQYREPYQQILTDFYTNGKLTGEQFLQAQKISREWREQVGKDRKEIGTEQARQGVRFILALDKVMQGT